MTRRADPGTLTGLDYWQVAREVCTPRQLELLELRERQGHSLRSTSLAAGVSVSTVRSQIHAAHHRIAKKIQTR